MFRALIVGSALMLATPALACPMADAAAFADAVAKVEQTDGQKVQLAVDGMSCGSCSTKVTKALEKIDGVKAAAVDYKTGETHIAFDATRTNLPVLLASIQQVGFSASPVDPS